MADYYFKRGGQIYGPVDFPGLQLQLGAGNVSIEDMLSHDPAGPWLPFLAMLPAFAPELTNTPASNGATTTATNAPETVATIGVSATLTATGATNATGAGEGSLVGGSIPPVSSNRPFLWAIIGLLAILLLVETFRGGRDRWEYKLITPKDVSFALEMNALGADGWEVVSVRRPARPGRVMTYEVLLKRKK